MTDGVDPEHFEQEAADLADAYANGELSSIEEFEAELEARVGGADVAADGGATVANPEAAATAHEALADQQTPDRPAIEDAEIQRHIENADQPDVVEVSVGDELVPCEPLGVGERIRPQKMAVKGEERGDDELMLEATLKMVDTLIDASYDGYDQTFWDGLGDAALQSAFLELAQKSAAGNGRGR